MDRVVRARFYQVRLVNERQTSFYDCLKALWEHPNRVTYQDLGGGTHVRIERWHESDGVHEVGFVAGEFVRQQTDNIPPVAEGGKPLRENLSPLGRVDKRDSPGAVIVIQAGICNGDQRGTKPDVERRVGVL